MGSVTFFCGPYGYGKSPSATFEDGRSSIVIRIRVDDGARPHCISPHSAHLLHIKLTQRPDTFDVLPRKVEEME